MIIFDRGLDSKGVVQYIIDLQKDGYDIIPLKGNHEDFILNAYKSQGVFQCWIGNGGIKCLESYGAIGEEIYWDKSNYIKFIPEEHWTFFKSLKNIHLEKDFAFVHAGLDFNKEYPLTETSEEFMLWERYDCKVNSAKIGGRKLVTGHTPRPKNQLISFLETDWINIDRGCCFKGSDYAHLAILNLDTKQFNFIPNIDSIEKYDGYVN